MITLTQSYDMADSMDYYKAGIMKAALSDKTDMLVNGDTAELLKYKDHN